MNLTVDLLDAITGNTAMRDRKAAFCERLAAYGAPFDEPAVMAQVLAQVLHESGAFRYVREVWGPTKAQAGYEGRADLGNTEPGDGERYMGRDLIQCTGRANYRALAVWWSLEIHGASPDFEADPVALERPDWLGAAVVWYFMTRTDLIRYCREGNIEMVTRRVNGGLNGYDDRLRWYDKSALAILGYDSVRDFQTAHGLVVDGISGPKTRAAMHAALLGMAPVKAPALRAEPPAAKPEAKPEPTAGILEMIVRALLAMLKGKVK
jgi:putative chitinase